MLDRSQRRSPRQSLRRRNRWCDQRRHSRRLVLSKQAVESPHVGKEIERASSKRRPIIALRTDSAPLTRAFEYFLSESQWIDVQQGGIETAITAWSAPCIGTSTRQRRRSTMRLGEKKDQEYFADGLADAQVVALIREYAEDDAFEIAQVRAYRGEVDEAFKWLDRAQKDVGLYLIRGDLLLKNLVADPRYKAFLLKMRLAD
jgi:hypothetical protein